MSWNTPRNDVKINTPEDGFKGSFCVFCSLCGEAGAAQASVKT